jgi:hypothetical protein
VMATLQKKLLTSYLKTLFKNFFNNNKLLFQGI